RSSHARNQPFHLGRCVWQGTQSTTLPTHGHSLFPDQCTFALTRGAARRIPVTGSPGFGDLIGTHSRCCACGTGGFQPTSRSLSAIDTSFPLLSRQHWGPLLEFRCYVFQHDVETSRRRGTPPIASSALYVLPEEYIIASCRGRAGPPGGWLGGQGPPPALVLRNPGTIPDGPGAALVRPPRSCKVV